MLFNKKVVVLMVALSSPFAVSADDATGNESIEEMLRSVPDNKVKREETLKKLEYLSKKLDSELSIAKSQAGIRKEKDKANTNSVVVNQAAPAPTIVEQQIQEALASHGISSSNTTPIKSRKPVTEFGHSVTLVSIYGNPSNPTADIYIDNRPAEVSKGSILNGWKVLKVTSEYLQLSRKKNVSNVFYSNSSGN